MLLLPFKRSCMWLGVSFSECSSRLVFLRMVHSGYVKQGILVYHLCKKNFSEIAQCFAEEEYSCTKTGVAKFLHRSSSLCRTPSSIYAISHLCSRLIPFNSHVSVIRRNAPAFVTTTSSCSPFLNLSAPVPICFGCPYPYLYVRTLGRSFIVMHTVYSSML